MNLVVVGIIVAIIIVLMIIIEVVGKKWYNEKDVARQKENKIYNGLFNTSQVIGCIILGIIGFYVALEKQLEYESETTKIIGKTQ